MRNRIDEGLGVHTLRIPVFGAGVNIIAPPTWALLPVYQSINPALKNEGAAMEALHVLAKDVGVRGVFSDWPATTTYYASCMGLK